MTRQNIFGAGAAALAAALACVLMAGCKGRTMDNMVPDGDTVEVMPDTLHAGSAAPVQLTDSVN